MVSLHFSCKGSLILISEIMKLGDYTGAVPPAPLPCSKTETETESLSYKNKGRYLPSSVSIGSGEDKKAFINLLPFEWEQMAP